MTLVLEAHNDATNCHRVYEISVERDLLRDWVVSVRYGRCGVGGTVLRFGSSDDAKARAAFRQRLRRRLSARRRIGCSYRLRSFYCERNSGLESWLAGDDLRDLWTHQLINAQERN